MSPECSVTYCCGRGHPSNEEKKIIVVDSSHGWSGLFNAVGRARKNAPVCEAIVEKVQSDGSVKIEKCGQTMGLVEISNF